jgi:hypothetical protein
MKSNPPDLERRKESDDMAKHERNQNEEIDDAMTMRPGRPVATIALWTLTLLSVILWIAVGSDRYWQASILLLLMINALKDEWL